MVNREGSRRDPVSVAFDPAARRLLARALAAPGTEVRTRLVDPDMRTLTQWAARGLDVSGPDRPSAVGGRKGGLDCRTRWARGFVRSLYYQWKWFSPQAGSQTWKQRTAPRDTRALRIIAVGRHVPASPQFDPRHPERGGFPAGRQVTIMVDQGGKKALAAVHRLSDRDRIWVGTRQPGRRFSSPSLRDWA